MKDKDREIKWREVLGIKGFERNINVLYNEEEYR